MSIKFKKAIEGGNVVNLVSSTGMNCGNPYIDLFYEALAPYSIELVGQLEFDRVWLSENINRFDAIHLHWPEHIWRGHTSPTLKKFSESNIRGAWRISGFIKKFFSEQLERQSLLWFEDNLKFLKCNNKKILWTWHNVEPHENLTEIDRLGLQILAEQADIIIFHSESAKAQCFEKYKINCETVIMHHGNYNGIYPEPRERQLVISELGLDPDIPIVGCIGQIRDYKGLDVAIEACALLSGRVQLLCAGKPHYQFDVKNLEKLLAKLDHYCFVPDFISDQLFSDYINACDLILLPYRKITGSGALLAALTLGKGVVASDLEYFNDLLQQVPDSGVLFPPEDCLALSRAISSYLEVDDSKRFAAAKSLADKYSWDKVVVPVAERLASS